MGNRRRWSAPPLAASASRINAAPSRRAPGKKALPRSVPASVAEAPPAAPQVQAAGPDPSKLPAGSSGQVPAAFSRATATSLTLVPVGPVITRPSTAFRA